MKLAGPKILNVPGENFFPKNVSSTLHSLVSSTFALKITMEKRKNGIPPNSVNFRYNQFSNFYCKNQIHCFQLGRAESTTLESIKIKHELFAV